MVDWRKVLGVTILGTIGLYAVMSMAEKAKKPAPPPTPKPPTPPAPPKEYTVTIIVVDASTRKPIEGARVRLGDKVAVTDSSGKAVITVTAGTYRLVVEKPGYQTVTRYIRVLSNIKITVPMAKLIKPPLPGYVNVTLRVVDKDTGQPISGATVLVNGSRYGSTDANGVLVLRLREGEEYTVEVHAEGYKPYKTTITARKGLEVTVQLEKAYKPAPPTKCQELIELLDKVYEEYNAKIPNPVDFQTISKYALEIREKYYGKLYAIVNIYSDPITKKPKEYILTIFIDPSTGCLENGEIIHRDIRRRAAEYTPPTQPTPNPCDVIKSKIPSIKEKIEAINPRLSESEIRDRVDSILKEELGDLRPYVKFTVETLTVEDYFLIKYGISLEDKRVIGWMVKITSDTCSDIYETIFVLGTCKQLYDLLVKALNEVDSRVTPPIDCKKILEILVDILSKPEYGGKINGTVITIVDPETMQPKACRLELYTLQWSQCTPVKLVKIYSIE